MNGIRSFVLGLLCLVCAGIAPGAESKSFPVGPGGRLFLRPDVETLLSRPYTDDVPMACTGECLWAAHPSGWAFANGVNYYLITPTGIGFDITVNAGTQSADIFSSTFFPSHVETKGGGGDLDLVGNKWITSDDVLVARIHATNRGEKEQHVWFRLALPSKDVAQKAESFSWSVPQPYGEISLVGRAAGFAAEPAEQKDEVCFLVEGEASVSQKGSVGPDRKKAASGNAVLGSEFGAHEGDHAEWKVDVKKPIENAVLAIRYARAMPGDAEYKVTVPGLGFVERCGFRGTNGWGDSPRDFQLATLKLGNVAAGTQTVRIVAVSDGGNVNIDAVCIQPEGAEFPGISAGQTAFVRELVLGPRETKNVDVFVAASTQRDKAEKALARIARLEDPLADHIKDFNGWLVENVPAFEADEAITKLYWHRATSILRKNLFRAGEGRLKRWGISEGRWTSDWYANMISYGAGHQIRETRWLRNPVFARDLVSTWCENEKGNGVFPNFIRPDSIGKGQYTDWITSTAWDAWCVAPDLDVLVPWLDALKRNVDGWLATYDKDNDGLLLVDSHWWTGMEWQPSFFYFKEWDKDQQDQQLERVDLTAYVYGNAQNLSKLLKAAGDAQGAAEYEGIARKIRQALLDVMWDSDSKYFYSVEPKTHEKALVKEVIGVYPFYFSMVPWNSPCADAWLSVLNKDELWTEWPVASASKKCPAYSQDTKFHGKEVGGCMWNGPTWPHANSLVLSAMAATIRDFDNPPLTADHFQALLSSFTLAQFREQKIEHPWTGEYYNGDTAVWRTDQRDYNHSTYLDIVIGDLAGLRPRPDDVLELQPMLGSLIGHLALDGVRYHGHDVSVLWDAPGNGKASADGLEGYRVYADGSLVFHSKEMPSRHLRIGLDMSEGFKPVEISGPGSF